MSRPEIAIKLSPRAQQDFIDILRYTGENWGERQLEIYRFRNNALGIIRILHQRMSFMRHLPSR